MSEQETQPQQEPQQEITPYQPFQPSPLKRGIAQGADAVANGLDLTRRIVTSIETWVKTGIDRVVSMEEENPKTRIAKIRSAIGELVGTVMTIARQSRMLEKVDLSKRPALFEDSELDIRIKGDINDVLDSRLAAFMSFEKEMEFIGEYGFLMGIPPAKLIAYFEDEKIIDLMTMEILNMEESGLRATSVYALFKSIFKVGIKRLRGISRRIKKAPVAGEIEEEIKAAIADFNEHYDPTDSEKTLAAFIALLREEYHEYDLQTWLRDNKKLLRGVSIDKDVLSYVHKTVSEVYERAGSKKPGQFMKLHADQFHRYDTNDEDSNIPVYRKLIKKNNGHENAPYFEIYPDLIVDFFNDVVPRIENGKNSLITLRKLMIKAIREKLASQDPNCKNVIINDNAKLEVIVGESHEELMKKLEKYIARICTTVGSHINVADLLIDPTQLSPEITQHYEEWFDGEDNFIIHSSNPYYAHLRRLFRYRNEPEDFDVVKTRVANILKNVNKYLDSVAEDLGIPGITIQEVAEINDYAELVKIACKGENELVRFAARRKIELATLIFSCEHTPLKVYQDHHAKALKEVMEGKGGITIDETAPLKRIEFMDWENGELARIMDDQTEGIDQDKIKSVDLIPATLGKTPCYLLPTNSEDQNEGNPREYIGKKSLFSMVTNLLTGEKKRAKDLTDLVRMTFVVDSIEDLVQVQQQIEDEYISFGRTLKRENRYGEFVKVGSFKVLESANKSAEYKTLRYVVDVPIEDEAGVRTYMAPIEIRVMLVEDLLKERSEFNDASHKKYEHRRLQTVHERVEPVEVFPERYKTIGARIYDIFRSVKVVPKTTEDYKMAA